MARRVGNYRSGNRLELPGGGIVWLRIIGPNASAYQAELERAEKRAGGSDTGNDEFDMAASLNIQKRVWLEKGVLTGFDEFESEAGAIADSKDGRTLDTEAAMQLLANDDVYLDILRELKNQAEAYNTSMGIAAKN